MAATKRKKAAAKAKPTTKKKVGSERKTKIRIRTYRHGLGDCHLLSFTKPDGSPLHVLIDCGVVDVTPNPEELMTGVAQNIAKETGGALDIVVATHQHTDHLSGFRQARAEFAPIKMKRLWFAWTEDKSNPLGQKIKRELVKKLAVARAAHQRLERSAAIAPRPPPLGLKECSISSVPPQPAMIPKPSSTSCTPGQRRARITSSPAPSSGCLAFQMCASTSWGHRRKPLT